MDKFLFPKKKLSIVTLKNLNLKYAETTRLMVVYLYKSTFKIYTIILKIGYFLLSNSSFNYFLPHSAGSILKLIYLST